MQSLKQRILNLDDFLVRGVIFLAALILLVGTIAIIIVQRINFLLTFYTILANLGLGAFVYFRGRRNPLNQIFCVLTIGLAAWAYFLFLSNVTTDHNAALIWNKTIYVISAFIPVFALFFSWAFPFPSVEPRRILKWLVLMLCGGFALISFFTDWIVKDVYFVAAGSKINYGFLHLFYVLYFIFFLGQAFLHLARKYRRSHGLHQVQIRYLFLGSAVTAVFPIITNMILPLMGNNQFTVFGPSFLLILIGVLAYTIVRHRLMSIEVVIQRSTVYVVATIIIMAIYTLVIVLSETFFRKIIGYSSLVITAAAALLIAVVYQPLVRSFQVLTDRLFFRGRYDYQKTLKEISQKIASVIRLEELSKLIVSSFIDTMKVSEISFLLLEREKDHFRSVFLSLPRYKKIEIDVDSPIISWLKATKDILVYDEIEEEVIRQQGRGKEGQVRAQNLAEVKDEMGRLGISIWVPIISKKELIGIIALGNKLSGDVFTTEDIGLLSTLANQTALALDNARLYNEVVNMRDYSEKILQSMVNGMLTVDNKGKIITYNDMAAKITGRPVAEVMGKTCEEVWGKRGLITSIIANTLSRSKSYHNFESNIASPKKGLVPVSFSSNILLDHDDKKMGALLSIQDLTEVKELEDKVRQADKLSALATMAAGMAHEIKNPLSSMKVLSQLIPKKMDDPEYRKKLGEIIPREINRIDRIVESLLGFARATALNFEPTDIAQVLDEDLEYFANQLSNAEVTVVKSYADLPKIEVDRTQIAQVFSNLILNAIQSMQGGGELKIEMLPGKKVEDVLHTIKVKISDTGHGISEDKISRLFDPFFTTKYGGTGLGLTISHSIVDGHKGYIDVDSLVGKGTTFTVTLPVSQGLV